MKKYITGLLCLTLGVLLLSGCAKQGDVHFEEKSYTADSSEVTRLEIAAQDRKIEVTPSPDNQIHLIYYESEQEFYEISQPDENTLLLKSETNKEWQDYIGENAPLSYRTISLQIPQTGLQSLRLQTSNEDLILPELQVSQGVELEVNNGNISFGLLDVGESIQVTAKNGDVAGMIQGGYDDFAISCSVKKGDCNLPEKKEAGDKSFDLSLNNGDANITFSKATSTASITE